jgi:hypothetical protein
VTVTDFVFTDAEPIRDNMDSQPAFADVEYPCSVCGAEAGPYGGRGRKPTKCPEHKGATPRNPRTNGVKITGSAAVLAAQAAKSLANMNMMIGVMLSAVGLFGTGSAIVEANDQFEAQAFAALSTDTELCKTILKTGGASAKLSLAMAYGGMAMTVGPIAVMEVKAKKAEREVAREEAEREARA